MLKENDLFYGSIDKVSIAIKRIKEFAPMALQNNPAGYYVCISGGKDSSVIQELCIMAEVKCEFVHNHTSVDYPETVYFVRREQERLQKLGYTFRVEYPRYSDGTQKTMWNGIVKNGLPTWDARWCCKQLKEFGGRGRYIMTGVRWKESQNRGKRGLFEKQTTKKEDRIILNNDNDDRRKLLDFCAMKGTYSLNPIIDWTDGDVWEFIKMRDLPVNPLYAQGYKRVGCIACPKAHNQGTALRKHPIYKAAFFRAVQKHIKYRKERGLDCYDFMETPEQYLEWWLSL